MRRRLALVVLALLAAGLTMLAVVGCGGSVPQGAVATVGGVPITKAQFDQYLHQAAAGADSSGRSALPSPGTSAYRGYASQAVTSLVQQQVVINAAAGLKITLSDQQVQAQLTQMAAQYGGVQKLYAAAQKAGLDAAQLATYVKDSQLGEMVYEKVTGKVTPTEAQMRAYYKANKAQFVKQATRTVRHLLVSQDASRGAQGAGLACRQRHGRQLGQGRRGVLDRSGYQERRWRPRVHHSRRDGQALREGRLLASSQHDLGAGSLAVQLACHRSHGDGTGHHDQLYRRQGHHQERARFTGLAGVAVQGQDGGQGRLRTGL